MMYAIEMASDGMICVPSFIKTGSEVHKLSRGDTHTDIQIHKQQCDLISLLLFFFQTKEVA
jgi:hypothetical protein